MTDSFALLLSLPALLLVAIALVPSNLANANVVPLRRWVTRLAGLQCLVAGTALAAFAVGALPSFTTTLAAAGDTPLELSTYYDGVSGLMFALVSLVGWVICRYSIRYLDGESSQGQYFRWTACTIGAVSLLVISGNLLMLVICWIATSLGLHQLLLHYGDRPAAQRAAWTKFAISRIGDASLLAALVVLYSEFGTLDFAELFGAVGATSLIVTPAMQVAALLLIIGAITKSAQFPFHTWLPQTMETPTPVSALMHAGIVNAGGYLMIRTSPIVSLAPWALAVLAIVGGLTACFAAVVMLTQTSVKKSLAYSTIAQMGFMMLQCGLGAFSAAMLHILAHSLYKAHAFLGSGSVMSQRKGSMGALPSTEAVQWTKLGIGATCIAGGGVVLMTMLGIDPLQQPSGLILGGIFCLAVTHWVAQALQMGDARLTMRSAIAFSCLALAYIASFLAVDATIGASLPSLTTHTMQWIAGALVIAAFAGVFLLHVQLSRGVPSPRLNAWFVHASNGFYLENALRRVFGPLVST